MPEWLDNLKQEIAWPYVQARNWYERPDNAEATYWIAGLTTAACVVVLILSVIVGKVLIAEFGTEHTVTVKLGNPCLTFEGKVKDYAPAGCYDSGQKHEIVTVTEDQRLGITRNNDASITPDKESYNPPCKNDGLKDGGCTDQIYGKRLISGTIVKTEFNSDEAQSYDGHLQPDYTEVEIDPCNGDTCDNVKEKFCGNVLDKFTPGEPLHLILNESKQGDYNGCYTVEPVRLTFGGDYYRPAKTHPTPRHHFTVPGSVTFTPEELKRHDQAVRECAQANGGTCG